MCIEIENYKQHDLFNYFDYNQIDTDADYLILSWIIQNTVLSSTKEEYQ